MILPHHKKEHIKTISLNATFKSSKWETLEWNEGQHTPHSILKSIIFLIFERPPCLVFDKHVIAEKANLVKVWRLGQQY